MRVWILANISGSNPGGMRRHMELHARGLRSAGHEATLLFAEDMAYRSASALGDRAPGARSLASLFARYQRERPDVVNVHTECAPSWILARRVGAVTAKIVVMSYAADEASVRIQRAWDVLRWARAALPARLTFPEADGVWCVNQQDVEYYVAEYGVDRRKVRRFPHAVADAFYEPHASVTRERRALFVGTWIHRKGTDVLRAALDRVVSRVPDLSVVLAGTLTGESTVRAALSPALAARTRVIDRANDHVLSELYRSSAVLLVPSRREGLPIGMLEAMACGCPPLAAANSGMLDVIEPGANGWLEVSFDPERWAARIEALFADPDALARASAGASATASAFRVDRVAKSVSAWYESLLSS